MLAHGLGTLDRQGRGRRRDPPRTLPASGLGPGLVPARMERPRHLARRGPRSRGTGPASSRTMRAARALSAALWMGQGRFRAAADDYQVLAGSASGERLLPVLACHGLPRRNVLRSRTPRHGRGAAPATQLGPGAHRTHARRCTVWRPDRAARLPSPRRANSSTWRTAPIPGSRSPWRYSPSVAPTMPARSWAPTWPIQTGQCSTASAAEHGQAAIDRLTRPFAEDSPWWLPAELSATHTQPPFD